MKKELIIIGLLITTYILTQIPAPLKKINETTIGDYVRIKGIIGDYANPPRLTIFNLTDETGSIKTVFFTQIKTWNRAEVEITGRITEYKGELELKGVKIN